LERLENELRTYATELAAHQPGAYSEDDYFELLQSIYEAIVRHHGEETLAQMSEATILKVIKGQVMELIRFKRINKLMKKRDHI
jgi:hypothetical protein